jgi:hypothetical protein
MQRQYFRFEAPYVLEREGDTLLRPGARRSEQKAADAKHLDGNVVIPQELQTKLARVTNLLHIAKRKK